MSTDFFIGVSLVIFGTIMGAIGAFCLKIGGAKIQKKTDFFDVKKVYILLIGVSLYGLSAIIFTFALQFAELSILYPFASLSYIWATFFSIIFLHEKINRKRWVGIGFIMLGVITLSFAA